MADDPSSPPPAAPSFVGRLLAGAGAGAVVGALVGWLTVRLAFAVAWDAIHAEGWVEAGLDRLIGLALGDVLADFDRAVLLGAGFGLLVALPLRPRRLGLPMAVLRSLGLLVLAGALLLEALRLETSARSAAGRPHIVWIVIDALRADHLGCYGYEKDTSPFLDALAASSVRFGLAVSQESYTMASAASYFTSRYPPETGVLYDKPDIDALGRPFVTIAEVLKNAGYDTGAFVFNPHLFARFQFDQGFDVYDDSYPRLGDGRITEQTPVWEGKDTTLPMQRKLTAFLEDDSINRSGRPKLLYLHYRDVHGPYMPPPGYQEMFLPEDTSPELRAYLAKYLNRPVGRYDEPFDAPVDPAVKAHWPFNAAGMPFVLSQYDGAIRYTDDALVKLFELLAANGIERSNTIVVVTADHGEEFHDGHPGDLLDVGHGRTLYMEQVHVPLIVSVPGLPGARVIDEPVELVDVAPTVLDAAGLAEHIPQDFRGRSLLPLMEGGSRRALPVFAGGNHGRGLVLGDGLALYHYETESKAKRRYYAERPPEDSAFSTRQELYSLPQDREQRRELLSAGTGYDEERVRALKALLDQWLAQRSDGVGPRMEVDDEAREALKALGYLGDDEEEP